MTIHVLSAVAKMNLRSIRAEVMAAEEEGLISPEDCELVLQAHALLTTTIVHACDAGRAGQPEDDPKARGVQPPGSPGVREARSPARPLGPRSPDAATLQIPDEPA